MCVVESSRILPLDPLYMQSDESFFLNLLLRAAVAPPGATCLVRIMRRNQVNKPINQVIDDKSRSTRRCQLCVVEPIFVSLSIRVALIQK
ncbi:hypothetical protein RvY_06964 [Ramazzottius varieornatus]|uniref:Uncharacterized protein n=1 Tax=Ramazzottius varieornatus TaxID=947166 RepID=A0A1D1V370_RAMVA|nr:hypothetical protein RvY_06964 [Ramazzottius varieornatus]